MGIHRSWRLRPSIAWVLFTIWAVCILAAPPSAGQEQDPEVAVYIKQLEHSSKHARRRAAEALGAKGAAASEAIDALSKASGDKELEVRLAAVRALGRIDPEGKKVIPVLLEKLRDEDAAVSAASANALADIGAPAVPRLIQMLDDDNDTARLFAIAALGRIGKEAKDAMDPLMKIYENKKENRLIRMAAGSALLKIGIPSIDGYTVDEIKKASGSQRLIIELKMESSPGGCMLAALVFAKFGPAARAAVPALEKAAESKNKMVALLAHYALAKITQDASKHVAAIVKALNDKTTRCRAAWALGEIGPPAEAALPALKKAGKDADPAFRAAASEAVKKITGE